MNSRPHSITAISGLFVVAGVIGLAYHATEIPAQRSFPPDLIWVLLVRLLAVVIGVFLFRRANWARWLAVIWMAYHVVLSAFHGASEMIVHGLLLAVIAGFLFCPSGSAYFSPARPAPESTGGDPVS
jgi:hypothetical protein